MLAWATHMRFMLPPYDAKTYALRALNKTMNYVARVRAMVATVLRGNRRWRRQRATISARRDNGHRRGGIWRLAGHVGGDMATARRWRRWPLRVITTDANSYNMPSSLYRASTLCAMAYNAFLCRSMLSAALPFSCIPSANVRLRHQHPRMAAMYFVGRPRLASYLRISLSQQSLL
ncbi:hypothetical protein NPIL_496931 [Nephila pilipes]|uniref:Uncharacterized protein n=1 Tax=Nephila pilipes TaxID=299642 RepID=A0A8X6NMK1_NEPPI|nr:hypothetical protein NPIL_496931 [Nephila pilipes]